MRNYKCEINTKDGEIISKRCVRVGANMRNEARDYIENLLKRGVIRKTNSVWRNPIRFLRKGNGAIRLVNNHMVLNDICTKDNGSLTNIKDILEETIGARYFTVLDLKDAFHCVEIKEEDKKKTAFEMDGIAYEWNGMTMGFKNAAQIMTRVICGILSEFIGKGVNVYIDDIVIYAKTEKEHDELVNQVCRRLEKENLRINPEKLQHKKCNVKLLGMDIDGEEIKPHKIKGLEELKKTRPKTVTEVRSFLGCANWARDYVKGFADKTYYLTEETKKNEKITWNEKLEKEYVEMIQELENIQALRIPDFKKEFVLRTDASKVAASVLV